MSDNQQFYRVSDYGNRVDPGDKLKLEMSIYPIREVAEIAPLTGLSLERLQEMRTQSAAAEQSIYDNLRESAKSWETQAAQTLLLDMAIEYVRVPEVQHTSNQWEKDEHGRTSISNMVYQMDYRISEQTHYDREQQKSIPYAWHVSWDIRTNSPDRRSNSKLAGQYQKRYGSMDELQKYMNGRIKAYSHLFTEISPPIPKEFAPHFKVNGQLLPGYTVAGEEPKAQEHAANIAAADVSTASTAEPTTQQQTTAATPTTPTEQSQPTTPATAEPTAPKTEAQTTNEPTQPSTTPAAAAILAAPFILKANNPRDRLKEITDKLENGVQGIFESDQYKRCLDTFSKFHNYSLRNCLLIAMQKPDATHIGGFTFWRDEMKRPVMKYEKGIKIIAPAPFKTKKTVDKLDTKGKPIIGADGKRVKEEQEITVPSFKVISVYDVSQTDGEPLPTLGVDELTGSVEQYKEFFAAIEKVSPVPVDFEKIKTGAKGYFHLEEKRIAINEGMSDVQNLKTLIHEIAHARIHDIDKNAPKEEQPTRRTREVEAESIAYTVCQHYGLDTSDYSFGYIASWSGGKELDVLKSSLDTIRKEADAIIKEVDKHFAELTQDMTQTVEQTAGQTAEQPAPQSIVADQAPTTELQTALHGLQGEVKETLQFFIDSDMKDHGEIRPGTLEMIAVQGFELQNGELVEAPPPNGTFSIYQVKDGNETRDIRFEPFDNLKQAPDMANYQHMYTAPLKHGDTLDRIYLTFNLDKLPEDFRGRSVSISDVIVMNKDGKETAHYVDNMGFKELPDFLTPKGNRLWQNYTTVTNQYPDSIVFNKVGDFYEVMGENANVVANQLGVAIAGRDVGLPERIPIVGIPVHNFDKAVDVLVSNNHKVAIAEKLDVTERNPLSQPAPTVDLKIVADYLQKQNDKIQAADPGKAEGQAAFSTLVARLEKANERIPAEHTELKALLVSAAQSPDLPTLKERMATLNTDFVQHYSTAVQNTIDTSGKAEPPAAAPTQQTDTPQPKAPAQGENVAAIEAKVKAGETINLSDLSDAIKKDKQAAQTVPTGKTGQTRTASPGKTATKKQEQPSIKEQLAAGKKQLAGDKSTPTKTATKNKNNGLGD